jgi:UDP-glucose 4-epimerase
VKSFVTGAAGFIGSHLTAALLNAGHEVVGLDDLSTGRLENLTTVAGHPGFRLVEGSILDRGLVDELTTGADRVFHFAAAVGSFVIRDRTLESLRTNIHGTENVAEAAHRNNARILVASTSEIYGKNDKVGLREDDDRIVGSPLRSRWSYAEAKAIDESLLDAYVRERGLWAVIARLFNTVGPGQTGRYGMVIPRFVRQALAGEPLTVFGTGEQVRCFCHVHDVIPALTALIETDQACGRAVNLGSSEQVSIGELARRVIGLTGSASEIKRLSYLEVLGSGYEDLMRRVPDCALAGDLVGFKATRPDHDRDRATWPGRGRGTQEAHSGPAASEDRGAQRGSRCLARHKLTTRERARRELGLPAGATVIGAVGRLTYQKAPEDFVDVIRRLRHPGVVGVWVGDGELAGQVSQLAAADPAVRVLLPGDRADVARLLPAFDVFVLPSRHEGLPTAIVEAMMCGVPVVATAVNAVADVVVPGETGLLVPPRRPDLMPWRATGPTSA